MNVWYAPSYKVLLAFGFLTFISVSVFGPWHSFGMETNQNGEMEGCIFTGKTMFCKMNIVEHIALWQHQFTTTPARLTILLALLILLAIVSIVAAFGLHRLKRQNAIAQKFYIFQHHDLPLSNPLTQAFSDGILHPRIYSSANL